MMRFKRITGVVLTLSGIAGFIFALVTFIITFSSVHDNRVAVTSTLLSIIFFSTGLAILGAKSEIKKV